MIFEIAGYILKWLDILEQIIEKGLRKAKPVLPHVARLCLCSTFLEDAWRMGTQWKAQQDYIDSQWKCGNGVAFAFVFINLFGQLATSAAILNSKFVKYSCYVLFGIILMQIIGYRIIAEPKFLMKSFAMVGAVLLLLAENRTTSHTVFDLPTLGGDKPKSYLQLSGRILLVLMFASLVHLNVDRMQIIANIVGCAMIMLIAVGCKTKLTSIVLVFWLIGLNFTMHNFWSHDFGSIMFDFKKYDFFQTMSVLGGLFMLIIHGPGTISVDETKKAH